MGMAFPVMEILLISFAFKTAKIPRQTMDYNPWGQKIESAQKIHAIRG